MTDLIYKQLLTVMTMLGCGFAAGMVLYVFELFYKRFFLKIKGTKAVIGFFAAIVISYMIGEFFYFCQNGKLSLVGAITFFIGLRLWYKYFYGIISVGEENEQKGKKTP